jgi:ABC-type branched-subunit amino acid transport system ATPase component
VKDQPAGGLPYGSRKLIDIARAMVSEPRLLLLDEPTSGLDSEEQAAVGETLLRLHQGSSATILVVEHHMDVVRTVADRVVALAAGSVVADGSPADIAELDDHGATGPRRRDRSAPPSLGEVPTPPVAASRTEAS